MKSKLKAVTMLASSVLLCSCGNMSNGFGNFTFKGVHIISGNSTVDCHVKSWHDNDVGIEVTTQEFGSLYLSEGTYILFESKCPICGTQY